ncbi:hypothetical protein HR45_09070 [Shewanella mangrovi]|uniref:Lipoprotein n=1 Tax=Shewanella mangrovi TaxID=1515746 RepID=A0A094LQV7_9GAMM|nr:hypothetical protein [Shewanella mangrovi]KFZ37568.1 hypothetical protein HR45_09070 [Shewanella mangrovi]
MPNKVSLLGPIVLKKSMRKILVFLSITLITACAAETESMSSYYPEYVGGYFYLAEDMALFEVDEHNYSFFENTLVSQSDCCASGKRIALLPKGTKIQIRDILRYIQFTNDCNEAIGSVLVNGRHLDFEYFINCNYQGVKPVEDLPWKREL